MSRIGKLPIKVPAGVTITVGKDNAVTVKGPKGELSQKVEGGMIIELNDGELTINRPDESKESRSLHGLYRSLLNNMVIGVSEGFRKELELVGVGCNISYPIKLYFYSFCRHVCHLCRRPDDQLRGHLVNGYL